MEKIQLYFKSGEAEYGSGDVFMGVRMGQLFVLGKEFVEMEPVEIEILLQNPIHEVRAGAGSIMDFQARGRLREAGKKDPQRLRLFFNKYAATMPRTALRYSIENLSKEERDYYLSMKRLASPGR